MYGEHSCSPKKRTRTSFLRENRFGLRIKSKLLLYGEHSCSPKKRTRTSFLRENRFSLRIKSKLRNIKTIKYFSTLQKVGKKTLFLFKNQYLHDRFGLLASKTPELLADLTWKIPFYAHIIFGGLALLVGWTQFSAKLRTKNPSLHQKIGWFYIISVLVSGISGIYIGFFATGGIVSALGFISLGVVWLYFTIMAFLFVRQKNILAHQKMMVYSFSACFAAVTLRIWLPILSATFGEFMTAYRIVAWLCWIPNLLFAYFWNRNKVKNN